MEKAVVGPPLISIHLISIIPFIYPPPTAMNVWGCDSYAKLYAEEYQEACNSMVNCHMYWSKDKYTTYVHIYIACTRAERSINS